jgi:hypothetical protein
MGVSEAVLPKRVFLFWAQGWDNAPELHRRVRESWGLHNPDWEVVCLDSDNVSQWVAIPALSLGNLSVQAMSDIVRLHVLNTHGGVWADATMICTRPLGEWVQDAVAPAGFWMYHGGPEAMFAAMFLLASLPGSLIISRWVDVANEFWSARPSVYAYQWVDHLFMRLLDTDPEVLAAWEQVPYRACDRRGDAHTFGDRVCFEPPDRELLKAVHETVPFAVKLNSGHQCGGVFQPDTNSWAITEWALTPRQGPPVTWMASPQFDYAGYFSVA